MSNVVFGKRNFSHSAPIIARDAGAIRRPEAPPAPAPMSSPSGRTGVQWSWRLLLAMIAFPAVWLGLIIYQGPPLLRDYRLASSFSYDFTVKVENAKCTAYWYMLKTCSVDYQMTDAPKAGLQTTNFMVAFTETEGRLVALLRSTVDRDAVTTQIALDLMTNRILTFFTLVVGMFALMVSFVAKLARSSGDENSERFAGAPQT